MRHKIEFTKFEFKTPKILSEQEYKMIKDLLKQNPKYRLNHKTSFIKQFKNYLYIYGFVAICTFIEMLNVAEWFKIVSMISVLIAFFSLFSFIPSAISFLEFLNDKSKYYSKLKKLLLNSFDYSDFSQKHRFL